MNRLFVLALVASVGYVPSAFAADSLLTSGARHVEQIARNESATSANAVSAAPAGAMVSIGKNAAPAFQAAQAGQGTGSLAGSGMRKRTKLMIAIGLGVGFAAAAWTIDHHVLDVTPSSLGTRQD